MKKFLGILVLSFLWCNVSYALDRETCVDLAAKANSEWGAELLQDLCYIEIKKGTHFYNRSKAWKCIKKAAEANSDHGAKVKYHACLKD